MPSPGAILFTGFNFDAPTTITAERTDAAGDNSTTYSFGTGREVFRGALGGSDTADWIELPRINGIAGSVTVRLMTAICLLYTSPSPRDRQKSRMPSSA